MAGVEAYFRAKFHLDPSNRLATTHQSYRQDRQTDRQDNGPIAYGEPFYKRSPQKKRRCVGGGGAAACFELFALVGRVDPFGGMVEVV